MGRPRLTWTDAQMRALLAALPVLERDFPRDNGAFLDALIGEVRLLTGRLYGATAYDNLLRTIAPQAGVARRPSSATIQQAVARAHALRPVAHATASGLAAGPGAATPTINVDAASSARSALADTERQGRSGEAELMLTRAALGDAHARIRRLEAACADLQRELGAAQSARDMAGQHVQTMLAELFEAIGAAGAGAKDLADTAQRLSATEQFLKLQNVAVRQQANIGADALRAQNVALRERVDHLLIENEQCRRQLAEKRTCIRQPL
ncbi:hypothetical protein [Paraburkholderia nodosa]|uniref:hypothetical protein n=1 Tax=Paraburkholderia nodosa TaxID=392320 RepID=UPI00048334DF|nr:hypothetical protein [Paraburkholderia nodosa]